ncbi:MAG: hypothetical protein II757_02225 [Bacteroidales bacterium]|nr:hypothetical protein [Bacteroidales bacterium]
MKKTTIYILAVLLLGFAAGCKRDADKRSATQQMTAAEKISAVKKFAQQMTDTIMAGDPAPLNDAIDTVALKQRVTAIGAALEIGAGMEIFHGNSRYGDYLLDIVENGGDFRFDTCYLRGDTAHLVLRTYDEDGSIQFDDLQLGFRDGQPVIQDAYIYSLAADLSRKIASETTINAFMTTDNPTEAAKNMVTVSALCKQGQYAQMWQLLNDQKSDLQQFTDYYRFYTIGMYECSKDFLTDLEQLRADGLDERFVLYHKLCYQIGEGQADGVYATILQLMNYTGDDPIYWLLYGKTLAVARRYNDALIAYNTAKQGMDYIWDIWTGELECYAHLGDAATFHSCLSAGKHLYGMTDGELTDFTRRHFPSMAR